MQNLNTYRLVQVLPVGVVVGRVLQDLPEQQRVFHQSAAGDVQEVPQVQLPAKGRLATALQEVLDPPILLLLVQQGLGLHLVTAVRGVGGETGKLQGHRNTRFIHSTGANETFIIFSISCHEKHSPSQSGGVPHVLWTRQAFWRLGGDSAGLRRDGLES